MQMTPEIEIFIKLAAATVFGGLIGLEREVHNKEAGLRTYSIVCLGAALIMIVSIQVFEVYRAVSSTDPARIAAQVVSGVGFLGAGAIIRSPKGVSGVTTAAGIWVAAGIGLACGMGQYYAAFMTTILVLFILMIVSKVNYFFSEKRKIGE